MLALLFFAFVFSIFYIADVGIKGAVHVLIFLVLVTFGYGQIQNMMGHEWDVYIKREGKPDKLMIRNVKTEECKSLIVNYKTHEYYRYLFMGAKSVYCIHQDDKINPWWYKHLPTFDL